MYTIAYISQLCTLLLNVINSSTESAAKWQKHIAQTQCAYEEEINANMMLKIAVMKERARDI